MIMEQRNSIILFLLIGLSIFFGVAPSLMAQSAQTFYIKAKLSPDNEAPAVTGFEGIGSVLVKITVNRDAGGNITSGVATFDAGYQWPTALTMTGLHIHSGAVGENGPVVIDSGLGSTVDSDGTGNITLISSTLTTPQQIAALNGLADTPHLFYIDLHTAANPSGAMRGQVTTRSYFFNATLLPRNGLPAATGLDARATVLVTIDVTRNSSGKLTSGSMMLDANYHFPGSVTFNGFRIHSGQPGENGPAVIDSGVSSITDPGGVGRITKVISLPASDTILNNLASLVADPRGFYVNLCTTDYPTGALSGRLSSAGQLNGIPFSKDDSVFRSNLGIQNLTNIPGHVLVKLLNKNGATIGEQFIYIPARGFVQLLKVNSLLGNNEPESAVSLVGDQHFEAFISMIENTNNFPSIIPMTDVGIQLAIASVTNVGKFRSTLVIWNRGSLPAIVDIISRDVSGNVTGQRAGLTIDAGGCFSDENILTTLGINSGYGPMEIRSTNDQPLSAISRVYSVADNRGSVLVGKGF
jgi:CHRD domain